MEKNIDPKYIGIPNICFSLSDENDSRKELFIEQRLSRGFDDSETWSFRDTATNFMLPRLKRYRELIDGFIMNTDNFYEKVDSAIRAFEIIQKNNTSDEKITPEEWEEYEKGMQVFGEIFTKLWW